MKRMSACCQSVNGRPIVKCFVWTVIAPNRKPDVMKELTVVGLVSLWSQRILACCQSEMRGGGSFSSPLIKESSVADVLSPSASLGDVRQFSNQNVG